MFLPQLTTSLVGLYVVQLWPFQLQRLRKADDAKNTRKSEEEPGERTRKECNSKLIDGTYLRFLQRDAMVCHCVSSARSAFMFKGIIGHKVTAIP